MKVFGVGLQKTGTTTLGECFKMLGYKHLSYSRKAAWYIRTQQYEKFQKLTNEYASSMRIGLFIN